MRLALGTFLPLHGVAHLPGFTVSWRGAVHLGDTGIRIMGRLWLLAALGFVVASVATLRAAACWPRLTLVVSLFSLVLSALAWPDPQIGVILNVVLLTYLLIGGKAGRLPSGSRSPAPAVDSP